MKDKEKKFDVEIWEKTNSRKLVSYLPFMVGVYYYSKY